MLTALNRLCISAGRSEAGRVSAPSSAHCWTWPMSCQALSNLSSHPYILPGSRVRKGHSRATLKSDWHFRSTSAEIKCNLWVKLKPQIVLISSNCVSDVNATLVRLGGEGVLIYNDVWHIFADYKKMKNTVFSLSNNVLVKHWWLIF